MKKFLFFIILMGALQIGFAKEPPSKPRPSSNATVNFRADCQAGNASVDLDVNNVRARLLSRGDFWWDYQSAKYIVPNVQVGSGADEVSSIFSGAVWMGGFDSSGNLKLAASDYASDGNTDYYPGPLDPTTGETDAGTCALWDRHFEVDGADITQFIAKWKTATGPLDPSEIPESLKFYPARGNPYFASQPSGFVLPDQDLGSFHDENEDGIYNPLDGDYPVISIRGCLDENYADQMYFQIYNDNGGPHKRSNASPIRMEVQVQAFAYATSDELNDMTFMRYRLINRAQDTISDCYFAMWVDADLGCSDDDYVGCDTTRSLAFYYNSDDIDGNADCSCSGTTPTPTYCKEIPLLGIDYFRGPLDENGVELGMSSFTYINRESAGSPPAGTTDPTGAVQYYNYLTGLWRDGTPFYGGDDGYQDPAFPIIKYAFPGLPNDPNGWSMAQEGVGFGDRRTVQASGPFVLQPGKTNELIIGLPWVPNVEYPVPDISRLLLADDKAQNLFDACFKITDGPDAPDMDIVELDREIIITLSNNDVLSNNKNEAYEGDDLAHSGEKYKFEGYILYQTINENVSLSDLDNPDLARIVAQTDVKNGVSKIYNWEAYATNPNPGPGQPKQLYQLVEKVNGKDAGVKHSFNITRDEFGSGSAGLINHRKYYYVAIAYAYNNFEPFDPFVYPATGQQTTFLRGRKTPYSGLNKKIRPITVIPRPSTYTLLNASYGDGPLVTRFSGSGTGGNFLKISQKTRENALIPDSLEKEVTYLPGHAPFTVKVVNPFKVKDGRYRITISDGTSGAAPHSIKGATLHWILDKLDASDNVVSTIQSDRDLSYATEEVLSEYGISIELGQVEESGSALVDNRGATGMEVAYADRDKPFWLTTAKDGKGAEVQNGPGSTISLFSELINFVKDADQEPQKSFVEAVDKEVAFYPFSMLNSDRQSATEPYYITPAWVSSKMGVVRKLDSIYHLNNVDIVFTSDKSKWSRCIITEAASPHYGTDNVSIPEIKPEGGAKQFHLRQAPSVGKDDADGDGLPDVDGDGDGMGWFPGYAVDVETGKRLNIFFSENSTYKTEDSPFFYPSDTSILFKQMFGDAGLTGGDMMFNPSDVQLINMGAVGGLSIFKPNVNSMYLGGQHFVYVTYDEYDECAYLRDELSKPQDAKRIRPLSHIQWAGLPITAIGESMLSYKDGLIPNDVVVSLRASNPYNTVKSYRPITPGNEVITYGKLPTYEFEIKGFTSEPVTAAADVETALDEVGVAPNPYYGYSYYERSQFTNIVKITNLPAKSTVTIYSLDGKFIRKFERNEAPTVNADSGYSRQIAPDVEWDLKNSSGIPIASGVYLIHVEAPGMGERIIKWFGMNRQFDPSGL